MPGFIAVFLIQLSIGQFIAARWRLRGASLVGPHRWAGYGLSVILLAGGIFFLPYRVEILWWLLLTTPLTLACLFAGGVFILPPPPIDAIFEPDHPAHHHSRRVEIPDGDYTVPGVLLTPHQSAENGAAVCVVHGLGDSKNAFKWRLIRALLDEGLVILTIDLPGHGDYRHRPLTYPEALTTIPAALHFLRAQPAVQRIGLIGISLGGAVSLDALTEQMLAKNYLLDLLVIIGTPIRFEYSPSLYVKTVWSTYYGAPSLSVLRETNIKQIWQNWHNGRHLSYDRISELFELLAPAENIKKFRGMPTLLVYSQRDTLAPPAHAEAMHRANPEATLWYLDKACHVMLTLIPRVNQKIARWVRQGLNSEKEMKESSHEKSYSDHHRRPDLTGRITGDGGGPVTQSSGVS